MNRTRFIESISGVFPHLERRIYTYLVCFCQRTLATIDIPYRARIMNRHAFYRKHFWCFSTFRTKNTHISCLFPPTHSSYDRYSLSSKNYEPHAFNRKHFWCVPHFERRIYTYVLTYFNERFSLLNVAWLNKVLLLLLLYLVCFCQRTLATIDIPYRTTIMNRTFL